MSEMMSDEDFQILDKGRRYRVLIKLGKYEGLVDTLKVSEDELIIEFIHERNFYRFMRAIEMLLIGKKEWDHKAIYRGNLSDRIVVYLEVSDPDLHLAIKAIHAEHGEQIEMLRPKEYWVYGVEDVPPSLVLFSKGFEHSFLRNNREEIYARMIKFKQAVKELLEKTVKHYQQELSLIDDDLPSQTFMMLPYAYLEGDIDDCGEAFLSPSSTRLIVTIQCGYLLLGDPISRAIFRHDYEDELRKEINELFDFYLKDFLVEGKSYRLS